MTFKEFKLWCNERSYDACWGFTTAITCAYALQEVHQAPFWKREKVWQEVNQKYRIVEYFVNPTNKKIEEYLRSAEDDRREAD
jgi:hypothetical protein